MVRALDVAFTPALAAARGPASIAVVVDCLRATSTIVTALENGAGAVIPVREQEEAIAIMRRLGRERVLLAGERNSQLIVGFDLDNSPRSYTRGTVAGKTIALTTTNGTRALTEAARGRTVVYCGALLNRSAIAATIANADADEALIICAGDEGRISLEDVYTAGAIADGVLTAAKNVELSDAARCALGLFTPHARRATTTIAKSTHAKHLVALGFADDIAVCARLDTSPAIPRYADGVITL